MPHSQRKARQAKIAQLRREVEEQRGLEKELGANEHGRFMGLQEGSTVNKNDEESVQTFAARLREDFGGDEENVVEAEKEKEALKAPEYPYVRTTITRGLAEFSARLRSGPEGGLAVAAEGAFEKEMEKRRRVEAQGTAVMLAARASTSTQQDRGLSLTSQPVRSSCFPLGLNAPGYFTNQIRPSGRAIDRRRDFTTGPSGRAQSTVVNRFPRNRAAIVGDATAAVKEGPPAMMGDDDSPTTSVALPASGRSRRLTQTDSCSIEEDEQWSHIDIEPRTTSDHGRDGADADSEWCRVEEDENWIEIAEEIPS